MDDAELLRHWRDGDAACGRQLFERHFRALYRFFCNKVGGAAEVDDLIQETLLAIVESPARFRESSSFRTYLFAIARNRLFMRFRARARDDARFEPAQASVADLVTSPSGVAARNSRDAALLEALRRLPVDMQVALELSYWEELSGAEIAAVIEVPEGTIRSRLRRGRELLRRELETLARAAPDRDLDTELERWAGELGESLVGPRPK